MTVEWKGSNGREFYLDNQIKKNKWSIGAEVGVRFGRTLFYLLDNNPRLQMYAIDIDISQFYSSQIKEKYGDRIIALEGNSSLVAEHILTKLDFVFSLFNNETLSLELSLVRSAAFIPFSTNFIAIN